MISVLLLLNYDWSVSVCNSLESLGENSGVALMWLERNSMAPGSRLCGWNVTPWPLLVGVHGGAPSIWSGKDSR